MNSRNLRHGTESQKHQGCRGKILALESKTATRNAQLKARTIFGAPLPSQTHTPHTLVILGSVQRLLPLLACIQLLS